MVYNKEQLLEATKQCKSKREFHRKNLCWHADKLHLRKECLEIFDKRFKEEFEAAMSMCSSLTEFRAKYTKFVWHLNQNLDKHKHKTYSFAYRRKYDKEIKNMFCNLNRLTA